MKKIDKNYSRKKIPLWAKIALGIMIGSSLFIVLFGILCCCMGETTEGIVCICVGAFAGSVFFLLSIAGKQEPSNKVPKVSGIASPNPNCLKTGSGSNSGYIFRLVLFTVAIVALLLFLVGSGIRNLDHYHRVRTNPLIVDAVVTRHGESEDSEGHTDYDSYITYTVNGITYKDIHYETEGSQDKLTPISESVTVKVSPEDPSRMLDRLENNGLGMMVIGTMLVAIFGSIEWRMISKRRCSKGLQGAPEEEDIAWDAKKIIWSDPILSIPSILFAIELFCWIRYSSWIPHWVGIITAVSGVIGGCALLRVLRRDSRINRREWTLCSEKLIAKKIESGSESGDSYLLHFRSDKKEWKFRTSKNDYEYAEIGTTRWVVYIPGKKKPLLLYNTFGDADTT